MPALPFNFFAAASQLDTCQRGHDFFGLLPWYHYLPPSRIDADCGIRSFRLTPPNSDVPLVLLAIVDDMLRIAAIVAVAFVIVGAINLITSQGEPEAAARAQSAIINALIGLVIAIVAATFVSFLGNTLGG